MKWNDKLKAMRAGTIVTLEKQTISVLDSVKECQNTLLSPFDTIELGHTLKFKIESLTASEREDYDIRLQERIAIMLYDGGLSESEAVRIATDEIGTGWQ